MKNLYIKSEKIYLDSKFEDIKAKIEKTLSTVMDLDSFIDIQFSNYNFMLNDILDLDIYIKEKDSLLEERIDCIEATIRSEIKGFKFETYSIMN